MNVTGPIAEAALVEKIQKTGKEVSAYHGLLDLGITYRVLWVLDYLGYVPGWLGGRSGSGLSNHRRCSCPLLIFVLLPW